MTSASGMSRRLVVVVVVVLVVGLLGVVLHAHGWGPFVDAQNVNRFSQAGQYLDPASTAATWAEDAPPDDPARVLSTTPAGIWITPEQHPVDEVGAWVAGVADRAAEDDRIPLFVVYGIPQRDCSASYSAGGTTAEGYLPWVDAIAVAAGDHDRTVVVLEPDALATAADCGLTQERVQLLRSAVGVLVGAGVTTYVDAGHSDWTPVAEMATLLNDVGVDRARGFATNVGNYQTTADEIVYAQGLLDVVSSVHYVIDTGRNGAGSTDQWCNPSGRSIGEHPGHVDDGTPLDALLWIKPPGESDGTCAGGPEAGTFWPSRAEELVTGVA